MKQKLLIPKVSNILQKNLTWRSGVKSQKDERRVFNRACEIDFKVEGGPWNTEKYCRPPWLADKKNFRIPEALEWLKQ